MNEKIESILREVRARRYPEVKSLLNDLGEDLEKLDNLQKFFDEVKNTARNQGKSNMVTVQTLENLIVRYGK